jgi:selenocysteine-specific elongation factor
VHHGSGNFAARVFFQGGEELRARETAIAQLRFDAPVFAFTGDRFVVRDSSGERTLAGGVVLDLDASVKNFRVIAQRNFLNERAQSPEAVDVFVRTQLVRDHAAQQPALLLKSRFSSAEISTAISELSKSGKIIERGGLVVDTKWWTDFRGRAVSLIDNEHRTNPNRIGLELARLRRALGSRLPLPEVFDALISELCESGFTRTGETIQRVKHLPTLPLPLQTAGARIRAALAAKPFDPPSRKELTLDAVSQQALRFLRDTSEVVEISDDVVLSGDAFVKMRDVVIAFVRDKGPASVSDLRQALGSSRRVVVPVLERFDREGVTRRLGDKRTLR